MTVPPAIQLVALVAAMGVGAVDLVIGAWLLVLRRRHLAIRPAGLAREAELLARPLPPEGELPDVVVQIPTFNEGALVRRAVAQATALDWPRERLHVQLLDDSTDGSVEQAEEAAAAAREAGFDVQVLHRGERTGFKAGALNAGVAAVAHPFFAIFDVDHVYPPHFLRAALARLLADDRPAFVQARLGLVNGGHSWLTRAQEVILDVEHGVAQAQAGWEAGPVPFKGTGGVWRREAIEAAGGWKGDTLVEDLDLSHRVWGAGWRGAYLLTLASRGEAAARFGVWSRQMYRWMAGHGEVLVRRGGPAGATTAEGLAGGAAAQVVTALMWICFSLLVGVAAFVIAPRWRLAVAALVAGIAGVLVAALLLLARAGHDTLGRHTSLSAYLGHFAPVPALFVYMGWQGLRSLPATLAGASREFRRTPKAGVAPEP